MAEIGPHRIGAIHQDLPLQLGCHCLQGRRVGLIGLARNTTSAPATASFGGATCSRGLRARAFCTLGEPGSFAATTTSWPSCWRWSARGAPTWPMPMKARCMIGLRATLGVRIGSWGWSGLCGTGLVACLGGTIACLKCVFRFLFRRRIVPAVVQVATELSRLSFEQCHCIYCCKRNY